MRVCASGIAQDMIAVPLGRPHRFAVVAAPDYFERHPKPVTPRDRRSGGPCSTKMSTTNTP